MKINFKIHPFFLIVAFIILFTGYFKNFIYITIIILVHEIGHIIVSLIFKWKIEKVIILPFGGITIFNEKLNRSIKEEFLILIAGPLMQTIFVLIINYFLKSSIFYNYHIFFLIFNLLPIFPLDGSKLVNIILDYFLPFKKSLIMTIYVSFIFLFLIFIYIIFNFNFLFLLSLVFLLINNLKEYRNYLYKVNIFLLERYRYSFNYTKFDYIHNFNVYKLRRCRKGIFVNNGIYYTEKQVLKNMFLIN